VRLLCPGIASVLCGWSPVHDAWKVRRFLAAVTKGMRFIETNRGESIRVLEKYAKQSRPVLEKTHDFIVPTISKRINMKGVETIHQYLVEFGIVPASGDRQGFVDLRFLPQDG
jgi:ABC-type nitrate/sulfonate/bicarbonate transport system substrate-binding protein